MGNQIINQKEELTFEDQLLVLLHKHELTIKQEADLKNEAYAFIIEEGLFEKFQNFVR